MHGYTSQYVSGDPRYNTNMSAVQDYADYNMYNMWVPCTDLVDQAGTALVSTNNDAVIKSYPDAVTTRSAFSFRKPKHWVNGVVTARVHYTGLYVVGTSALISLRIECFREGDALASGTYQNVLAPTPTADNVYMISSLFEDTSLTTGNANLLVQDPDRLITLSFRRSGSGGTDTYTSDFELIGLEVFYREYKHTSYSKVPGIKWTS